MRAFCGDFLISSEKSSQVRKFKSRDAKYRSVQLRAGGDGPIGYASTSST